MRIPEGHNDDVSLDAPAHAVVTAPTMIQRLSSKQLWRSEASKLSCLDPGEPTRNVSIAKHAFTLEQRRLLRLRSMVVCFEREACSHLSKLVRDPIYAQLDVRYPV